MTPGAKILKERKRKEAPTRLQQKRECSGSAVVNEEQEQIQTEHEENQHLSITEIDIGEENNQTTEEACADSSYAFDVDDPANWDTEMGSYVDDQSTRPLAAHKKMKRSKLIIKSTSTMESLPGDVVLGILARVPAHDIHSAARLVCSKWYQTIRTRDFVRAHLWQSTCGLVIQTFGYERDLKFATQNGPIIEIMSDFDFKCTGNVLCSCNGLILERHQIKKPGLKFRIMNPATKQHLVLPSIGVGSNNLVGMGLAYAVASKEYKVVRTMSTYRGELECAVLTVGVDEDWKRRVDTQHLSPSAKNLLTQTPPLSADGFVHWAPQYGRSGRDSEYVVVTLNVETEIITQFPALPSCCDGETKLLYRYIPMGSCLSLLISRSIDNKPFPIWDQVWVMKPETGDWTKMNMSIDSEHLKRAFQGVNDHTFYPVGWLKPREVLVFASHSWSSCIAYNVRTHEIESFEFGFTPYYFVAHQNSLVWLDGC